MNTIVTFSGIARSGKDTAAQYAYEYFERQGCKKYTFSTRLKELALDAYKLTINEFNSFLDHHNIDDCYIGDENFYENKTPLTRSLLIAIGRLVHNVRPNYFAEYIFEKIKKDNKKYSVITDIRFTHEYKILESLKDEYKIIKILVTRDSISANSEFYKDHSEKDIEHMEFDFIIKNNGTLEDLKSQVINILKQN